MVTLQSHQATPALQHRARVLARPSPWARVEAVVGPTQAAAAAVAVLVAVLVAVQCIQRRLRLEVCVAIPLMSSSYVMPSH